MVRELLTFDVGFLHSAQRCCRHHLQILCWDMGTTKPELSPTASSPEFAQAPGRKAQDHGHLVLIQLQRQMLLRGESLSNCNRTTEEASPTLSKASQPVGDILPG